MAKEIKIPQISEGVDTAVISEILVSEGDKIEEDQSVISVETDKATAEVPATSGGTIKEIKVSEGDEVNVGDVIIILEDDDDSEEKEEDEDDEDEDEKDGDDKKKSKSSKSKKDKDSDESSSKEVYASPGVRRLARELGVNIKEISGSGESGRITEKDVKEF